MIFSRFTFLIGFSFIVVACSPKVTELTQTSANDNSSAKEEVVIVSSSSAWYQIMVPGTKDGEQQIKLRLELIVKPDEATVDSIYFKGMIAPLRLSVTNDLKIYSTKIGMKSGQKADPPFALGPDDAGLICHFMNKRQVVLLKDLEQKEAVYAP